MNQGKTAHKILIIDDDLSLVKLAESLLQKKGYEVLTATDAPLGLEMAMKESPDLILLDVMMPIINGYNICRLMKSQEKYKNIPIILLTSRSSEEDRKIGEEVGADEYEPKPFDPQKLFTKIESLLNISE